MKAVGTEVGVLRPVAEAVAMMGVTEAAVKTQTTRAAFSLADAMRHDTLSCDKSSNVHVMAAMRVVNTEVSWAWF